ncbi:MAG: vitamin B12 dependent-methionine synthase activation domain-containing protein [Paludibacter sp.]|nr:vitamin B12 dependent-methionine synthase activation domain-containing protein [Paludibacter sp.]
MSYTPAQPKTLGLVQFTDIDLHEIVPFIHWTFFFMAWRLNGKFEGIETVCDCASCQVGWLQKFSPEERPKAQEAVKLYKDAQEMLRRFLDEKIVTINAAVGIYHAHSEDEDIVFDLDEKSVRIPTLRQQQPSTDGFCYSLADFLAPENDFAGVFANTVIGADEFASKFEKEDDMYYSILVKTLADRLAEATAEWLHYKVRKKIWGYMPDEPVDIREMFKTHYTGIRPAVGYPSLPDQSIIFELDQLIRFNELGITLTENGAMYPNASVCGLYFAHPKSKYFNIGKIDEAQFLAYARRWNKNPEILRKWMAANL